MVSGSTTPRMGTSDMNGSESIRVENLLKVLWRRRGCVLGVFLASLITTMLVSFVFITPIYEATVTLMISQPRFLPRMEEKIEALPLSPLPMASFKSMFNTHTLRKEIIKRLKDKGEALSLNSEELKEFVSIGANQGSPFIILKVLFPKPHMAEKIANEWAALVMDRFKEMEFVSFKNVEEKLDDNLRQVKQDLQEREEELRKFQSDTAVEIEMVMADNTKAFHAKLPQLMEKLLYLSSALQRDEEDFKKIAQTKAMIQQFLERDKGSSSIEDFQVANELFLSKVRDLVTRDSRAIMKDFGGLPLEPEKKKDLKAHLQLAQTMLDILQMEEDFLGKVITSRREELQKYHGELAEKRQKLNNILTQLSLAYNAYYTIARMREELRLTPYLSSYHLNIVEQARAPEKPIRPRKELSALLSGAAGLLGGILLALFLESRSSSQEKVEETG